MNHIPFFLALAAMIASPSYAQSSKKTKRTTTTTTTTETETRSVPSSSGASGSGTRNTASTGGSSTFSSRPEFSAGGTVGTAASKFHFGGMFQVEFGSRMQGQSFRFGGQTGFLFGPSDPTTWIIPILITGTYNIPNTGDIKPYIGAGFGVSLTHVSGLSIPNPIGGGTIEAGGATNTDFAVLIKPGANFGENQQWFGELPFGSLGSDFAILPTVGYRF